MIHYVDAVVAVTVMRVLLFVCMLGGYKGARVLEREGDGNAGVEDGGGECRACGWYTSIR